MAMLMVMSGIATAMPTKPDENNEIFTPFKYRVLTPNQGETNTDEYVVVQPPILVGFSDPRSVGMKRVIADTTNRRDIEFFKAKGCLVRHKLRDATSLECPENIVPELNVRESRIFHIMDLEADVQIGADKVWAEAIDGTGVTVAVLDTGVQSNHEELSDSIVGCKSFVAGENCEDYNGHGTHVAGIITANGVYTIDSNKATGVAPGAEVYMLKVCGEDGYCHEDDMMAAMEYVVLGPDGNLSTGDELPAKVMSISIGGGSYTTENCDSDPLAAKVNWVVDNGIVVSVAAGNDGKGVSSPGCASGAITVGAVDKSGYVPYWSGRGPAVDIVAPGADILSTYSCLAPGAEDCTKTWYAYKSGTSMATPHIAGVAALLLQAKPDATVGDVETALYDTTSPVSKCYKCTFWWGSYCFRQAEVTCTPEITGAGVVNAYDAYLAIEPEEPECTKDADCNDSVGCTDNSCDVAAGVCVYTPNDANCPADGWVDTTNTRWVSTGECTEKEQKEQEYRDYYCDAILDYQYTVTDTQWVDTGNTGTKAEGTACEDGLFCTVGETCLSGVCTGGEDRDCFNLSDQCNVGVCDETIDSCVREPANEGVPCDDGLFCTINDACTAGMCSGGDRDCSDEIACTVDSCDEVNDVCVNTPDNAFCENGLFCDGVEICDLSLGCQPGTPVDCDDDNECTIDSCDEDMDACGHTPMADNTTCMGGICCSGTCTVPACSADTDCNDGDACTVDTCNNAGKCSASCSYEAKTQCINDDGCCPAGCDYTNDNDCPSAVKCWSTENKYLGNASDENQLKKFCKCAQGDYAYQGYRTSRKTKTAYWYKDSVDNTNWDTTSDWVSEPVYKVKCSDGVYYRTKKDYFYTE